MAALAGLSRYNPHVMLPYGTAHNACTQAASQRLRRCSVQSFGIRSNVASSVILAHLSFPTWERLRLQEQCPQVKLLSPRIPPSSFHWYGQTALPGRGTAPSPTSIWVCPLLSLVRSAIFSALILVNLIGEKHCMSLYLHFNFSNKWIWSFYKCSIFGNMNNKINNTGLQPKEWNKYP